MKVFHFTEQPYSPAWTEQDGPLRIVIPNKRLDPKVAGDLFHRYYDEWQLADELGFDIMCNEHHSTATCMASTVVVTLSVLARITKRAASGARLSLGASTRPAARGRRAVDDRRGFARPAQYGLRQGRALGIHPVQR